MVRAAGGGRGSGGFGRVCRRGVRREVCAGRRPLVGRCSRGRDAGDGLDLGGEPPTVKPCGAGARARRPIGRRGSAVRAGDPADRAAPSRCRWQLVEDAVGEESSVHAVQGGGESIGDVGQSGHDLGELLDDPPAAQLRGVVRDRLEPQHAFAFGVGLAGQAPEVQLEHGQVIRRCLDRGLDGRGVAAGASRTLRGPNRRGSGTSNRERVRSTTASKRRCIVAPSAKIRLRLYSS